MKSQMQKVIVWSLIILAGISLACSFSQPNATPDIAFMVIQTQTAIALNQTLTAAANISVLTPSPSSEIPTLIPSTTVGVLATPSVAITNLPNCINQAKFISESIPDGMVFAPNQPFRKIWTLQNIGTCTWTPDYALVFSKGESFKGASPIPLTRTIPPGGQVELAIDLTAPSAPGDYQGFWKLRTPVGVEFALGQAGDVAFWVKITVSPTSSNLNLGEPNWLDTFDTPSGTWYLGDDGNSDWEIENGHLKMTSYDPIGDLWRVAFTSLANFYLEAEFRTGDECEDGDTYGFIVRAPDQPNGVLDTGYVVGLSCSGKFRIYRMDDGVYVGLQEWKPNPGIQTGPNATNLLGVQFKGNQMEVYVNGAQVKILSDSAYTTGYFGLMIGGSETFDFEVIVTRIAYWLFP